MGLYVIAKKPLNYIINFGFLHFFGVFGL